MILADQIGRSDYVNTKLWIPHLAWLLFGLQRYGIQGGIQLGKRLAVGAIDHFRGPLRGYGEGGSQVGSNWRSSTAIGDGIVGLLTRSMLYW